MKNSVVSLKEITKGDLEFARTIRNNNRRYFFNPKWVTKKAQLEWFKRIEKEGAKSWLFDKGFWFYIIWLGKERIGTVSYRIQGEYAEVGNVVIDNKYRRKGYLRKALRKLFIMRGKRRIFLKVMPNNVNAIDSYLSLGFKERERILWK